MSTLRTTAHSVSQLVFSPAHSFCLHSILTHRELADAFLSSIFTKDRSAVTPGGPDLLKTAVDRSGGQNEDWMIVAGMGSPGLRTRSN